MSAAGGLGPPDAGPRWARPFAAYLDRANARRQLRRLRALDDHMLRDIGITRADLRGL